MIKKVLCAVAITSSFVLNADVTLDARLLLSKENVQTEVQSTIRLCDSDEFAVISLEKDDAFLQAKIEEYTQDGVVIAFKVGEYDSEGNVIIVSEPKLRCAWEQEATFEVNTIVDEEGAIRENLQLRVVATN